MLLRKEQPLSRLRWRKDSMKGRHRSQRPRLSMSMPCTTTDSANPPPPPKFQPGDMVLVNASNIRVNRPNQKLASLCLRPFKVLEAVRAGAYRVKLPPLLAQLYLDFPLLKLFLMPADPFQGGQQLPPPDPVLLDGQEHYKVEQILDFSITQQNPIYKWVLLAVHTCT